MFLEELIIERLKEQLDKESFERYIKGLSMINPQKIVKLYSLQIIYLSKSG